MNETEVLSKKQVTFNAPEKFVAVMDMVVEKTQIYNSRSDLIRDAWKEFKDSPIKPMFEDLTFTLCQARFFRRDHQELIKLNNHSEILRIALILYLLNNHMEEIA